MSKNKIGPWLITVLTKSIDNTTTNTEENASTNRHLFRFTSLNACRTKNFVLNQQLKFNCFWGYSGKLTGSCSNASWSVGLLSWVEDCEEICDNLE